MDGGLNRNEIPIRLLTMFVGPFQSQRPFSGVSLAKILIVLVDRYGLIEIGIMLLKTSAGHAPVVAKTVLATSLISLAVLATEATFAFSV